MRVSRAILAITLLIPTSVAFAKVFPDVSKTLPHSEAIDKLSELGVISGYPDGTFRPRDPINRAGLLKMLYIAAGVQPAPGSSGCFKDVEKGSWYEVYVCDAVKRGFVQGYENNTLFRPSRSVTRAEGLKLSVAVFGLSTTGWPAQKQYLDVKRSDWYAPYLDAAVANKMLPIPGQEQYQVFYGTLALSRGEAASFIWRARAWREHPLAPPVASSSSSVLSSVSSSVVSSVVSTSAQSSSVKTSASSAVSTKSSTSAKSSAVSSKSSLAISSAKSSSVASSVVSSRKSSSSLMADDLAAKRAAQQVEEKKRAEIAKANTKQVSVPFTSTDTFSGRLTRTYRMAIPKAGTIDFSAQITSKLGNVSCRFFRLERDGVSVEYYLGFQEGQSCYLRVAVQPGTFQMDVEPTVADTSVKVEAKVVPGDLNDGFSQAKTLLSGQSRTDMLDANDLADWYTFTIPKAAPGVTPPELKVSMVSTDGVSCLVYPMSDVDLFGFTSPQCNQSFAYPGGTYMINIRHVPPRAAKQAYTVSLLPK